MVDNFAAVTQQISLRNAKAFFAWCCKQKLVTNNPFSEVQAIGKAKKGKPQLRQDEARKLTDYLIGTARSNDRFALALLVQLLLGLRSAEVLGLRKRDLDCDATIVAIDGTKTVNAKRRLKLACPITRKLLVQRGAALAPGELIFAADGSADRPPRNGSLVAALARCCKAAGVLCVRSAGAWPWVG